MSGKRSPLSRPGIWIPLVILASVPVVFVARTSGSNTGMSVAVGALLFAVLAAVATLLWQWSRMVAGVDPEAPVIAAQLATDPDEQRLLARWMTRARRCRNIGGLCGLAVWLFGTRTEGDLLMWGVGGIAVGAMIAELHVVKPTGGRRIATLEVRTVADYLTPRDSRLMLGSATAAAALLIVGASTAGAATARWTGVAGLCTLAGAHLVQRRVATRARPALPAGLRRADDLARELSIGRGLARPASYFAIALFAHGMLSLRGDLGDIAALLGVAAWLTAFLLWWWNRRLGLDFVLDRAEPVLA